MCSEGVEAHGVLGEELVVEHRAGCGVLGLEHALGDGLQQGHVAAQPDLQELVGDVGAATRHAAGQLRVLVAA